MGRSRFTASWSNTSTSCKTACTCWGLLRAWQARRLWGSSWQSCCSALRYASQHCPSATLLQPGGQVCHGLLARFGELVADMDDGHFAKAIAHVADLNWVPGA